MVKVYIYNLISLISISNVLSHGYVSYPLARQSICYSDGGFNWPNDGSNIPDESCRAAYRHVYSKVYKLTFDENLAAQAAQKMFIQQNEYAKLLGSDFSLENAQNQLRENLCSAGASDYQQQFGDKSGMSLENMPWQATKIEKGDIIIEFCATAEHYPNIFYVFITKPQYNGGSLKWSDLQLIKQFNNVQATDVIVKETCSSSHSYKLPVSLPYIEQGIIYIWWQRDDPAGEGFYNCIDFIMNEDENDEDENNEDENNDDENNDEYNIICKCKNV